MIPFDIVSSVPPQHTHLATSLGSVMLIDNNTENFLLFHMMKNLNHRETFVLSPFEQKYFVRYLDDDYDFYITSLDLQKTSSTYHVTKKANSVVIYETPHNYQVTFFYFSNKFK